LNPHDSLKAQSFPRAVRVLLILVAITAVVSLLYAVLYYAGGPIRLPVVSEIYDLSANPNNGLVAAGDKNGDIVAWDIKANWAKRIFSGHTGPVIGVAFTPDGATLISASQDGTLRWWDVASGQTVNTQQIGGGPPTNFSLSADGSTVATAGGDGTIQVWNAVSAKPIRTIGPNANTKYAVALSADGALVAADDGVNIQIWNTQTGEAAEKLLSHCEDETIVSQDACDKAKKNWLGHTKAVTALAFSDDGQYLASGGADTAIMFWNLASGEVEWPAEGHWATVTRLLWSPDGKTVLSGGKDSKAHTLRVPGGKSTALYEGHLNTVSGVAFGLEPNTILTGSTDGSVREWETANQKVVHTEWARYGLQPVWGKAMAVWMLISGLLGLLCLWGLRRVSIWSHLLALALYLIGPIIVLGLPLFEVLSYPLTPAIKLQIAWPLIVLAVWYVILLVVLTREPVALFYEAPQGVALAEALTVSRRTSRTRFGIYSTAVWIALLVILYSVLRRFNLDIAFMRNYFSFIMAGAGITLYISAASIALAVVLALFGALGRLSKNPIANGVSSFYISLIRGTPLLVQIYIWYLGLPRLGIVLQGALAGILALGVNYGAYMTEIFRAGIQAIGKGQYEAAEALGMTRRQTFQRIVLPQAFRIIIPPIGNEFIAMMKDSSLVSVMAIWELTYRAQKIGRQNFRNMETFIIAAAFYWILTVIFQYFQGRLEEYMARGERR
jgi:polar amino acid transport system permease protein